MWRQRGRIREQGEQLLLVLADRLAKILGKDAFGRMVSLLRARRSIILDIVPGAD